MKLSVPLVSTLSVALTAACARQPAASPAPTLSSSHVTAYPVTAAQVDVAERVARASPATIPTLDAWAWRYPDAAKGLGEWIVAHPETAHTLAQWQERYPEKMEALVDWATTHPYESLGSFFFDRTGWDDLRALIGGGDDAEGFVSWVRRAPQAAREVAFYSNGLAFLAEEPGTLLRSGYSETEMRKNPLFPRSPR